MAPTFPKSKLLSRKAHSLIPGGAHTYAKGDDQYPIQAPCFIARGEGCRVWDIDGNEFIEYGMGLRAVTLGHGYRPVVEAAYKYMTMGSNFTRPAPIEVECAEELLGLIENGDMAKFAKDGSDVNTAAIKLARAYTGRDLIARCADQPFFATDDWFIGSTSMSAGIPQCVRDLTVQFRYNDLDSVRALFDRHPRKIACVVLEAATAVEPKDDFLNRLQRLCEQEGVVFILDEMITGFRWDLQGAQKCYGIKPHLATFGKAMANGFSVSALVGRREIMELGGLEHKQERVFLLSTTHGAETHALAAAKQTMQIYKRENVVAHLYRQGDRLRNGIRQAVESLELQDYFEVLGKAPNLIYATRDVARRPSQAFRALFLQETICRGLLIPSLVVSFSHTDSDIDQTVDAIAGALGVYKRALDHGVEKYLVGRSVQPVFRKFN